MKKIKSIFFNEGVLTTVSNNLIKIVRGPILAAIIVVYLSPVEQGYWYTFQSLILFAIIGDFGISRMIIIIFPKYFIEIKKANKFSELKAALINYSSNLFTFLFLYIFLIVIIFLILLCSVKLIYNEWTSEYFFAWTLCAASASLNLISTYVGSVLYSLDEVSIKNYYEQIFGIVFSICAAFFIIFDFGLFSLGISILIGFIISNLYILLKFGKLVKRLFFLSNIKIGINSIISTKKLQFKFFSSSLLSLYISSSLVPFVMKLFDPVIAGQLGLSIFIINSIVTFSLTYNYVEYPKIVHYINELKFKKVKSKCFELFKINNILYLIFSIVFILFLQFAPSNIEYYFDRFLSFDFLILILITQLILMNIGFVANIVRGFKVEPYWKLGIIQVFTTSILFYITYKYESLKYYLLLDLILHAFILAPITIYLGKNKIFKLFKS